MKKNNLKISQAIEKLPSSGIRKFFDLVLNTQGVISLGIGEPDFITPWKFRESGIYALEKGFTCYTSNAGMIELRVEIFNYLNRKYNLKYNPEDEILITVGSSEALDLALRAVIEPGDEVIIPQPTYVSYTGCTLLAGGVPVMLDLKFKDNFKLKPESLEKLITKKTKALIFSYPSNPTGAIMDKSSILKLLPVLEKYNFWIIADEIYHSLMYAKEGHYSLAMIPQIKDRVIFLNGVSKTHAMTGWRLGYACGNHKVISAMTKIHQYTMLCASVISQLAALDALKNGDEEVNKMVREYDRRRKFLLSNLREMGLECFEPQGAFYAFPSIAKFGLSSEVFCEKLLRKERVALVPGTAFGSNAEGFVRISYAASFKKIEDALKRLQKFIKRF